jgi:hypothetical protein
VTPWAALLVAVIISETLAAAGQVFSLFVLPSQIRDLFAEEFGGSDGMTASATQIALLTVVPYLVTSVLILIVAIVALIRLIRSGRPVRWRMALLAASLAWIPVGLAVWLAQWPVALAVNWIWS